MRTPLSIIGRGAAILFAVLALLAVVAEVRGRTADLSLWLVDLRDLPGPIRLGFLTTAAVLLLAWALRSTPGRRLRWATAATCVALALVAVGDAVVFAQAVGSGLVDPAVPVPLSAFVGAGFAALAMQAIRERGRGNLRKRSALGLLVATGAWAVLFPLAQVLFFGTTDYRRPADAAVVFGARVYANGQPSPLLADRLRTGIELYRSGLVPRLVVSGGDGSDGFNEALVMRDVAVAAGVPAASILVDPAGDSTEATVHDSLALLAPDPAHAFAGRLIAVSQAYHLPRIQLAYANAGIDVITVPAPEAQPIVELPMFIAREVPAFWAYLVRECLG